MPAWMTSRTGLQSGSVPKIRASKKPHPAPLRRRGSVIRTKKKLVEIKNSCLQKSNSCNSCPKFVLAKNLTPTLSKGEGV